MTQQTLPDMVLSASSLLLVGYVSANLTRGDAAQAECWLDANAPQWRLPERPSARVCEVEAMDD